MAPARYTQQQTRLEKIPLEGSMGLSQQTHDLGSLHSTTVCVNMYGIIAAEAWVPPARMRN